MTQEGFPRGGHKTTTSTTDKTKKKHKNKSEGLSAEEKKKKRFIESDKRLELPSISYDTLVEGALCLGFVRQVRETSLLISLPGMTAGVVDIKSISRPYTEILEKLEQDSKKQLEDDEVVYPLETMFKVGDIVVAKVLNVIVQEKGKHKVSLTLDPQHLHQNWIATDLMENIVMTGAVKSKEDKGYIMDLGIKGVSAFLPQESALGIERKLKRPLGIGQLISVNISRCEIKRLMAKLTLNSSPNHVKQVMAPDTLVGNKLLLPGMKVSCIIVKKGGSGMILSILDTIGRSHTDHLNGKETMEVGDSTMGRILFIPPWEVGPYLTLDELIVPYLPYPSPIPLPEGEARRRKGLVMHLEPRGAKVKLQGAGGGAALLKRQRASDKLEYTDEEFKKDFRPGTQHLFRVLEWNPLDKLFILSAQESKVAPSNVLAIDELIPGSSHTVTITSYNDGGCIVKLSDIKGFIPYIHMREKISAISPPFLQKKHPIGSSMKARVFQIDAKKSSIILTCKKSLLRSTGLIASSISDLELGSTGHGIVKYVPPKEVGLLVQGVGGCVGFVPKSKLPKVESAADDRSLALRYPIGSAVEFKVLEINLEKGKAIFSLDMELDANSKVEVEVENKNKRKLHEDKTTQMKNKKFKGSIDEDLKGKGNKSKKDKKNKKAKAIAENDEIDGIKEGKNKSKKRKQSPSDDASLNEHTNKKKQKKSQKQAVVESDSGIEEEEPQTLSTHLSSFWQLETNAENGSNDEEESEDSTSEEIKVTKKNKKKQKPDQQLNIIPLTATTISATGKKSEVLINEKMTEKDYELHLVQSPSDILAWRQLKLYAILSGNPGKAVNMIKGILGKIPITNEIGKREGWMCILSIEAQYGSEDAAKSVLEEALKVNDPLLFRDQAAKMFENQDKIKEAEELYRRRLKFNQTQPQAWINLGNFLYKNNKLEAGRILLPTALHSLSEGNQIYVTAKFAKMEIEMGDVEKGRAMFLTICLQRPKRTDLWLLYANSLYKMKDFTAASEVLKTALEAKKLSPRECRPILKRLLEIETAHGSPDSLQELRLKAAQYLNI